MFLEEGMFKGVIWAGAPTRSKTWHGHRINSADEILTCVYMVGHQPSSRKPLARNWELCICYLAFANGMS